ncbi:hypothetical protein, variant 7 [Phytophthora nicotianae CJ01A1]|uniref:GRIP domain-containing protein n=4 Tax=Phytophthora nicotianae TaxID=4792 RepID=W2PT78_PHYN3|nr:hypothetical protein, variant 6 [Phytophthora nicotianae INRA-310]XP_008911192.1 hypothetical protein, variant 7 [Phytophthora nicotianae INRA-310]ETL31753.1 hypothetical protein, variant 6 [Phytophthora nicotianae]ETO66874.1 hypothetical protein, variant 6 [Phytophthora nicotianae P1976]ETP07988.1 hypothetical protein, variant 6 [Phytophthora nicotianae CJ01A1]ETL31754.1 hypothetical protein, variant 7 [Phytophthora nicotianae]ETL84981.1 hypothetical protein, variant 6 [Phytophthora nicot
MQENKLKRLLAMAKRSIDNSKQELAEKDETIQKLREELAKSQQARHSWFVDASTRDPRQLLHKVAHGNLLWCLVEYVNENELDDSTEFAWHCFHNEEEIQEYANRATGEPLTLPDLSMAPYEVERVKKSLKEEIDRVQEEFRRYRVRSEITRKQKDAEIRKMSMNVMAKQTEQISETDLSGELQSSKAQIRRLTKAQAEAEERESDWRRKFEKLMKDYEKLSGTMGETILAMEWRERYEQSVREKQELEKKMEELKLMTSGAFGNGSDNGNGDLQSLRQEFAQYRKRALNAVEQKEKELNDIQAQYHENGGGSSNASRTNSFKEVRVRRMSMESNSSLSGFETPNATKTNEYLKNIVYKYMASDQDEAKEHMEKAIATVLNFTPAEISAIQEKRKQQQGWFW